MARIGSLLLCALAAGAVHAAAPFQASAQLTAERVQVGETFPLIVQAQTEGDGKELPEPQVALTEGFAKGAVRRSQGSSTSIQIVNGSFSKKVMTTLSWQIDLKAVKVGTWQVGPVTLAGRNLGQGQVTVEAGRTDPNTGKVSHDVTAATLVGKKTVFVGQQLPFTWRLEAHRQFQVKKFPDVRGILGNGFWTATPDTQPKMQVIAQGNSRMGRLDVPGSLFPLRPGTAKLAGTSLDYQIVEQEAIDPFEAFFAGRDPFSAGRTRVIEGTARTQEIPLVILPLPEKNRPASFQGGVGTFKLEAHLEKDSVRAGDGVNLVVTLEGDGQPQGSGTPVWKAPAGLEAYPPEDKWSQGWKGARLWATLERRIVLVPAQAGKLKLPPVTFSYFDPETRSYRELSVELPALRVLPSLRKNGDTDTSKASLQGTVLSGKDRFWILFGKVSAAIWGLLLAGGLVTGIVTLVRRATSPAARRRRAFAKLRQELSKVRTVTDSRKRALGLRNILCAILVWELGELSRGWTLQETVEALQTWPEERRERLTQLWKDLDAAEFAGTELAPDSLLSELLA